MKAEINICNIDYTVMVVPNDDIPGCYGETNKVKKEIKIAESDNKAVLMKTILHELTHAYLEETGYRYTEFDSKHSDEEFVCEVAASVGLIYTNYLGVIEAFINKVVSEVQR